MRGIYKPPLKFVHIKSPLVKSEHCLWAETGCGNKGN
jgi:hypothetical protein